MTTSAIVTSVGVVLAGYLIGSIPFGLLVGRLRRGIDIRLVVETSLATINTGIAHREPGVGQVGAGIVKAPLKCFQDALVAFAETMGVQ